MMTMLTRDKLFVQCVLPPLHYAIRLLAPSLLWCGLFRPAPCFIYTTLPAFQTTERTSRRAEATRHVNRSP